MCRSRSDLIENAERFARIDLDWSDFEKERTPRNGTLQYSTIIDSWHTADTCPHG